MTPSPASANRTVLAASLVAGSMIAQQVGGKAARDAFFLSQFEVASLPTMMVASALVSIVVVRAVMGRAAAWLVPRGFAASSLLLLGEWALAPFQPRIVAVVLYLHIAVFGSVLISGFWSLVTDRFDPHTARKRMGQIATGASVGAVVGGVLVERAGAIFSVTAAFPILALLHLVCAVLVLPLRPTAPAPGEKATEEPAGVKAGMAVLKRLPYLRNLAYLVFLGAVSAALIDYAFKAEVAASLTGGEAMMRFFALYYTAIGIVGLVVQSALSRRSLERLGLAGTSATLPATVIAGSVGMIVAPGLASALAARGGEAAVRSSLFRSGYELFYSPVAARDKRAVKTAIDVLWERLGDVLGGAAAKALLVFAPLAARHAILALAALLGGAALWICHRLHRGYVEALEASLRRRRLPADGTRLGAPAGSLLLQTGGQMQLHSMLFTVAGGLGGSAELAVDGEAPTELMAAAGAPAMVPEATDPLARRLLALRSPEPAQVRAALDDGPLEPLLAPQAIELLARDEVAGDAARALRPLAATIAGQLGDALVDPDRDFVLRRRIPGILAASGSARAVGPLIAGLGDRRFEVRYRCGRALGRLQSSEVPLGLAAEEVEALVLDEVRVDRRVWEEQLELDGSEPGGEAADPYFDQLLRKRARRRLEHVFTLLGLILPREPLRIAFRGLHTDDEHLRGTALEYLDSVLPKEVRDRLWPYLTPGPVERRPPRSRDEIVTELMRSSAAIDGRLEEMEERDGD